MLPVPDCGTVTISKESRAARIRDIVARYRAMNFGVPAGWTVVISPEAISLAPGDEQIMQVDVTPPAGFTGQLPFNVNAFADGVFAGGVTLTVTKA